MDGRGAYVEFSDRQQRLTANCAAETMCGFGGEGIAVVVIKCRDTSYIITNKTWLTVERQRQSFRALDQAS